MAASAFATSAGLATERGAADDATDTTYYRSVVDHLRTDISAVPGSGDVNCVFVLAGSVYAIRDNAAATDAALYKASADGWVLQDLGSYILFDAGTAEFLDGEPLTGGSSGATATIGRVAVIGDKDWGGGTAAGLLSLTGISGTFQTNETITSTSGSATSDGPAIANSISVGGTYHHEVYNFGAAAGTQHAYLANTVDYGFEWNGTVLTQMRTGQTTDTPSYVKAHRNHLMWAFGSSVVFSAPGLPLNYFAASGAGEIGVGDTINGFLPLQGGILSIHTQSTEAFLYGTGLSDFELRNHAQTQGGRAFSAQQVAGHSIMYDELGLVTKVATDAFGDFRSLPFSQKIQPILSQQEDKIVGSLACVEKGHYRVYFNDKTVISVGFNDDGVTGFMNQALSDQPTYITRGTTASGDEIMFFGCDDGFVYQLDKGTSFDGGAVVATLRLAFNNLGTPQNKKRYFVANIEMQAPSDLSLNVTPDFAYSDPNISTPETTTLSVASGGAYWDFGVWDSFNWSEAVIATGKVHINGSGSNIGLLFYSTGIYTLPHTLEGYTLHYATRGLIR